MLSNATIKVTTNAVTFIGFDCVEFSSAAFALCTSLRGNIFDQNPSSKHASAGMIGVNIGVPVPREPFSFGGWNESRFGSNDITGKSSIEFWTKLKKTTTKWNPEAGINWMG